MEATKIILPLSVTDFALEITTDEIGKTAQILYSGRPACGMSEFSSRNVQTAMVDFLRQLADDIQRLEMPSTSMKGQTP